MIKKFEQFSLNENIDYNSKIEFSILKSDLTPEQIDELVSEAKSKGIKIISTKPEYVNDIKLFLDKHPMKISVAIDFPDGKSAHKERFHDINEMIILGVNEIELTIDFSIFNKNDDKKIEKLKEELNLFSKMCHRNGIIFKIIINLNKLTLTQIRNLSTIANECGVDYIQTSTGEVTDMKKLEFLTKILPEFIKIKVAGGIRNIEIAKKYINLADRIGTSSFII